ncbi:MAG TPA: glycosyltransferase family 87 protein [Sphingomicrobium sp.]|jgi:hypothetical protein|nr:glycosyltransferase family 87 protein [Sphingomicrobium sp.]
MTNDRIIRWGWVLAWSIGGIAVVTAVYAAWRSFVTTPGIDFVSFWAAGRLAIDHKAVLAYDLQAHRATELTFVHLPGLMPFAYPPPFLLLVTPFGLFSFRFAFAAWQIVTGAFYLVATRRRAPLPTSIVLPPVFPNALVGQNGFLFTGIFAWALEALQERPFVGGMLFGCFVLKPQLAPLIPVALVAARAWRPFTGAALSSTLLLLAGLVAFGSDSYLAWARMMTEFGHFVLQGSWPWTEMASVFAFCRFFGMAQRLAFVMQLIAAGAAAIVTWRAWSSNWEARGAVLAAATILVPPYLFTYDALLLIVPFAWLLRRGERRFALLVWVACLPAVLFYFHLYVGPNTVPIAAILCVARIARVSSLESKSESHRVEAIQAQSLARASARRRRARQPE